MRSEVNDIYIGRNVEETFWMSVRHHNPDRWSGPGFVLYSPCRSLGYGITYRGIRILRETRDAGTRDGVRLQWLELPATKGGPAEWLSSSTTHLFRVTIITSCLVFIYLVSRLSCSYKSLSYMFCFVHSVTGRGIRMEQVEPASTMEIRVDRLGAT